MHVLNVWQLRTNIVYMYSSLCLIASVFLNLYVSDIHAVLKIQFFFFFEKWYSYCDHGLWSIWRGAVNRGASFVFLASKVNTGNSIN